MISKIDTVANLITRFGGIDGEHHKQWLLDQTLRLLLEDNYVEWLDDYNSYKAYDPWDEGIAP